MKFLFEQYKLYFILGAVGLVIAGMVGSFFFGMDYSDAKNAQEIERQRVALQKEIDTERERRQEVSARFEQKLGDIKIVNTTINRKVEKEVEKAIYVDPNCAFPESGTNLLNENADLLNAARKAKK